MCGCIQCRFNIITIVVKTIVDVFSTINIEKKYKHVLQLDRQLIYILVVDSII